MFCFFWHENFESFSSFKFTRLEDKVVNPIGFARSTNTPHSAGRHRFYHIPIRIDSNHNNHNLNPPLTVTMATSICMLMGTVLHMQSWIAVLLHADISRADFMFSNSVQHLRFARLTVTAKLKCL